MGQHMDPLVRMHYRAAKRRYMAAVQVLKAISRDTFDPRAAQAADYGLRRMDEIGHEVLEDLRPEAEAAGYSLDVDPEPEPEPEADTT